MKLTSIRLENVGGFTTAELPLRNKNVLVGENNSGKTSLLRVLEWCLQVADERLLRSQRGLADWEAELLTPARPTRNAARRLFLRVRIEDGRVARRFCDSGSGIANLRIQFRKGAAYAKLATPTRGEAAESEGRALDLLARLQSQSAVVYVPAARDSNTKIFQDAFHSVIQAQLRAGFLQPTGRRTGAPKRLHDFSEAARLDGTTHATRAWETVKSWTSGLFEPDASFEIGVTPEQTLDWLTSQVVPKFSFSDVDSDRVPVNALGAGPQSVLAMALITQALEDKPNRYLLLEEPESFLHPSAQRTLANQLLNRAGHDLVITTHSPEVVSEVQPYDLRIMVRHAVFGPKDVGPLQEQKDRYLLSNSAARAMFARSVLLVEGPGEEAFFEVLRRRLLGSLSAETLSGMQVVPVGGKTAFGPWLRLLGRYRDHQGEPAIRVLFVVDSADGIADARRALTESGFKIGHEVSDALSAICNRELADFESREAFALQIRSRTAVANSYLAQSGLPLRLAPVDLEYAMLGDVSDARAAELAATIGHEATTRGGLLSSVGSKGGANQPSDKPQAKAPYKRALFGENLAWHEIPGATKALVWDWALGAGANERLRPDCLGQMDVGRVDRP